MQDMCCHLGWSRTVCVGAQEGAQEGARKEIRLSLSHTPFEKHFYTDRFTYCVLSTLSSEPPYPPFSLPSPLLLVFFDSLDTSTFLF